MTHRLDVAHRHDLVARWCALAEQRLQYLTEMFESGRWRRYHSERAFLENIKEAKIAVETWRGLSMPASIGGLSAVAESSTPPVPVPPRRESLAPEPPDIVVEAAAGLAPDDEAPVAIDMVALERALYLPAARVDMAAIEQRYPSLRNAL